jgi:type VI secretion system secreted protein VgrG
MAAYTFRKISELFPRWKVVRRFLPSGNAVNKRFIQMKGQYLILPVVTALAVFSLPSQASTILNSADSFAVLGGSTVTSTGNTILNGNLGVYPGTSITGFAPGIVQGTTYLGGAVAQQAERDAFAAYHILLAEAFTQSLTGQDLGGLTLTSGVYYFSTSAQLTGTLTLDAQNDPDAIFIFQIGSTLITAGSASINLVNGAQAANVFWQVGTSVTLGADTSFDGSILADQSITLEAGTSLSGRALALNAAVTLDDNVITVPLAVPEPDAFSLLVFCAFLIGMGQWFRAVTQNRAFQRIPVACCCKRALRPARTPRHGRNPDIYGEHPIDPSTRFNL